MNRKTIVDVIKLAGVWSALEAIRVVLFWPTWYPPALYWLSVVDAFILSVFLVGGAYVVTMRTFNYAKTR